MARKYAVFFFGPNRSVGLAARADRPCAWDGARGRLHPHHLPQAARMVHADSLYLAQSVVSRDLGCARAANPERLHAVDGKAGTIRRGRRVHAQSRTGHYWKHSDAVLLSDDQARGRLVGSKGGRVFARGEFCRRRPCGVVQRCCCGPADRLFGIDLTASARTKQKSPEQSGLFAFLPFGRTYFTTFLSRSSSPER